MLPEEVNAQIESLRKFIIPPKGASKADIDAVFGVPEEQKEPGTKGSAAHYPMHMYQLLAPVQGQDDRAFLYVTYKNETVDFIGINHLCVLKNRGAYREGSPEQIKEQQEIDGENVLVLADLIEVQKKYENQLKNTSWNKSKH